jgi:membrane protease YdiL (CAAX protease family)
MPLPVILFLIIVVVALPFLSLYNYDMIEKVEIALPPKKRIYLQSAQNQLFLAALAMWAASRSDIDLSFLGDFNAQALLGAGVFLLAGFLLAWFSSRSKDMRNNNPGLEILKPETNSEKTVWVLVNVVAAACEEIIFRGVLFFIFLKTSHSMELAGVMSAVCFGFSHSIQGYAAIAVTIIFGLGLQYLAWLNNGLLLPMIAHFIYNIVTTIFVLRNSKAVPVAAAQQVQEDEDTEDHTTAI